ncbi:unnamed protein product [Mytilus coruscus]|uniref:Zinc finger PHD-type domain-containing protein n=1 Tax=Mytilus coruscus TaxID=42192 RepID=A0A6J8DUH6_MYTCO|nr:unnamed protein product [Mytilus coruscus]
MDQNATNTSQEFETLQIKQKISRNDHLINNESIQETSLQSIDLCPMCQQPSHNDTVGCSECSLWLLFSCAGILDKNLPTFRQNDFICQICSENLLSNSNRSTDQETPEQGVQPIENHEIKEINTLNTTTLNNEQRGIQQEVNDLPKIKGKKPQTKSKANQEISLDKAYISQLETQIERLTSTNHQHHQPYLPPKLPGPPQYHHSAYTQIPPPAVHQMYLPQNHQYVNTNLMYRQAPAYYRPTIPAQQRYHPTHVNQNTYVEQPTQPNVTTGLPYGYQ